MHKCWKCGKEFEGKFCPDCGAEWQEEKTCPQCGAKLRGSMRFCNECGYSFANQKVKKTNNKSNKFLTWIKTHLKIVLPVSISLVIIIVLLSLIPTFIALQTNGTYYKLNYNGEVDKKTYFILQSGKWTDEDGESGTYKKDGDSIVFYVTFFGETEELCDGTLIDDVLSLNGDTYISEKHKHNYGEWETTRKATCLIDGIETRTCTCGVKETQAIKAVGYHSGEWITTKEASCSEEGGKTLHCTVCGSDDEETIEKLPHSGEWVTTRQTSCSVEGVQELICNVCGDKQIQFIEKLPHTLSDWIFVNDVHYKTCTVCGAKVDYANHEGETSCSICNYPLQDSVGLQLTLNSSEDGYIVSGLGTLTDNVIRIPQTYNNLPVVSIADNAFYGCSTIKYITIPASVISIGSSAFRGCNALTNVIMSEKLVSIGSYAFYDCSSLLEITIPEEVTSIGEYAFYYCAALIEINFNAKNCTGIRFPNYIFHLAGKSGEGITVNFGSYVTQIPDYLFFPVNTGGANVNIKSIVFAENSVCESIGLNAFRNCATTLQSIILPKSIKTIEAGAFSENLNPTTQNDVFYMGTENDWKSISIATTSNGNFYLLNATIYYYSLSNPYTSNTNDENLYWHYVNGELAIWTKEN